jgi:DNA-binding transcriptional regulator YiaG
VICVSNVGWITGGPWQGRMCIGCSPAVGPESALTQFDTLSSTFHPRLSAILNHLRQRARSREEAADKLRANEFMTRRLREGAMLSRGELARRAGIPLSTLRGWEGDRGFPELPAARRLAEALGVPVERFAAGLEDPAEEDPATPGVLRRRRRRKPP